ncbi:MAG: CaiB/BaiF CoA transferase family protein [Acidimicrobiia bacterium]
MTTPNPTGEALPLAGLVVADFSRILAGPLCTMILADLGADVIKIERPGQGDDTRSWGPPFVEGDAAYFLSINRNKRSIVLDLNDPDDLELARGIVNRADVVVENFRPGVMAAFGLDYDTVAGENPDLVYCSIPAFARSADKALLPGYDLLMQAFSGFMSITGEKDGEPVKMGVAILDVVAGLYGVVAILAALRQRDSSGSSRRVQVGLFEASIATLVNQAANYLIGGTVPTANGNAHPNIVPYQSFTAGDGRFVVAAGNDKLFQATCRAIDREDLLADSRFETNADRVEHREVLTDELERTFGSAGVGHWVKLLAEAGVPAAPVRSIDEVFESPESQAMVSRVEDPVRGVLSLVGSPIDNIGLDGDSTRPPPRLGEHQEEIERWVETTPPRGGMVPR